MKNRIEDMLLQFLDVTAPGAEGENYLNIRLR